MADQKHLLSGDQADRLRKLLDAHTEAWAQRYGGRLSDVERLLADSRAALAAEEALRAEMLRRERELEEQSRRRDEERLQERAAAALALARRTRLFGFAMMLVAAVAIALGVSTWRAGIEANRASLAAAQSEHKLLNDRLYAEQQLRIHTDRELGQSRQIALQSVALTKMVTQQRRDIETQRSLRAAADRAAHAANVAAAETLRTVAVAEAQNVANEALEHVTDINTDVGMLLAVEAYDASPSWQTRGAVLSLVQETPRLMRAFRGMQAPALSQDGRYLAVAVDHPPVYETALWDLRAEDFVQRWEVRAPAALRATVQGQCFTDHDRRLVTLTVGGTLRVYDVASHALLKTLQPFPLSTGTISYDRNVQCATGSDKIVLARAGTVGVFDGDSLTMDWQHTVPTQNQVVDLAIAPRGAPVAVSSNDGSVSLWDAGGKPLLSCPKVDITDSGAQHPQGTPQKLTVSPDGTMFAAYSEADKKLKVYKVPSCEPSQLLDAPDRVGDAVFVRNDLLLDLDQRSRVLRWNPLTGNLDDDSNIDLNGFMAASNLEPATIDGAARYFATAYYGDGVFLYTLGNSGLGSVPLYAPPAPTTSNGHALSGSDLAAFSDDGRFVVQPLSDARVRVWKTGNGQPLPGVDANSHKGASGVLLAPGSDRAYVFEIGDGHPDWLSLDAYDVVGGGLIWRRRLEVNAVRSAVRPSNVALSRDGRDLIVLGRAGLLRYSLSRGTSTLLPISTFRWSGDPSHTFIYLSPFGTYVVFASQNDKGVDFSAFDAAGKRIWEHQYAAREAVGSELNVDEVAGFSADGDTLLIRDNEYVDAWNLRTKTKYAGRVHLESTRDDMYATMGPRNDILAVETSDPIGIQLYDVKGWRKIGNALSGASGYISQIFFSPDESAVGILDKNKDLIVYDIDAQRLQARACQDANRNLGRDEWRDLNIPFPYQDVCAPYGIGSPTRGIARRVGPPAAFAVKPRARTPD